MELIRENLFGDHVTLELIEESHREGLREAANDPKVWKYATLDGYGDNYDIWFDDALKKSNEGQEVCYIVREKKSGKLVGTSRYYFIDIKNNHLEIGYTWYNPSVWGGVVNPSCKYLLFKHAFEKMGASRVGLRANSLNKHSFAAMEKAGAKYEGTMRNHVLNPDGVSYRHSVIFSVIIDEWPEVKAKLEERL